MSTRVQVISLHLWPFLVRGLTRGAQFPRCQITVGETLFNKVRLLPTSDLNMGRTFASGLSFETGGRQTCFLSQVPSNIITPLYLVLLWGVECAKLSEIAEKLGCFKFSWNCCPCNPSEKKSKYENEWMMFWTMYSKGLIKDYNQILQWFQLQQKVKSAICCLVTSLCQVSSLSLNIFESIVLYIAETKSKEKWKGHLLIAQLWQIHKEASSFLAGLKKKSWTLIRIDFLYIRSSIPCNSADQGIQN